MKKTTSFYFNYEPGPFEDEIQLKITATLHPAIKGYREEGMQIEPDEPECVTIDSVVGPNGVVFEEDDLGVQWYEILELADERFEIESEPIEAF